MLIRKGEILVSYSLILMRFRLSFPGYCTPWQTIDKTVVMVIYSQNVKLMGEQKVSKSAGYYL